MAAPTETIPDLSYQKPDGSLFFRREMEEQTRQVWPKVHWLRIKANKIYGLPKLAAFDMREVVLRHWVLDEMVRRGQILGGQVGVSVQNYNDENEQRQFAQSLAALIQTKQAVCPAKEEGIDMSTFTPPPPPPMPPGPGGNPPNGGGGPPQQFSPPPPPMGGPMPPPPGYGAQAPYPQPGFPPQPQQFAPPQPSFPPNANVPGAIPPGPPVHQVTPPAPTPGPGRGRRKATPDPQQAGPPPVAAPVPPMPGAVPQYVPQPQGFAPLPAPALPQQQFVPPTGQAAPAPANDVLLQKLEQLTQLVMQQASTISQISRKLEIVSLVATASARVPYQQQTTDAETFLKAINIPVPQ